MTAIQYRQYALICDSPLCTVLFRVDAGLSRAELRRRAARAGRAHVHEPGMPVRADSDYCPEHAPGRASADAGRMSPADPRLATCRCDALAGHPCTRAAAAEDLLCDVCRDNPACVAVQIGGEWLPGHKRYRGRSTSLFPGGAPCA